MPAWSLGRAQQQQAVRQLAAAMQRLTWRRCWAWMLGWAVAHQLQGLCRLRLLPPARQQQ